MGEERGIEIRVSVACLISRVMRALWASGHVMDRLAWTLNRDRSGWTRGLIRYRARQEKSPSF